MSTFFRMPIGCLYIFFRKMSLQVSVHILFRFVFDVELSEFLVCLVGN